MYDVIVIGSGPSGLMAAIKASETKKVLLLEKNDKLGLKLLASGNGRCNLTNVTSNEDFIRSIQSTNKKFIHSALSKFGPWDIYSYFSEHILLKEEDNGRIFPDSDNAKDVLNVLIEKLKDVTIKTNEKVININKENGFIVKTNTNEYKSKYLVLALGGASFPSLGTSGDGYKFIKDFNLELVKPTPALTSLNSKNEICKTLQGITIFTKISYNKENYTDNILFTHFGLSGPAIFKISESVVKNIENKPIIKIDFIPDVSVEECLNRLFENKEKLFQSVMKEFIPLKVVNYLFKDLINLKINTIEKKKLMNLIQKIKEFEIEIDSSKGFNAAFVTSGGLELKEVNPATMEVKKIPGLYVTGELLDIHALTGGYNITIALATGFVAGSDLKEK